MPADRSDPRPARSRARLLDAATALPRSGGPSAVTVDAVTSSANVARATLYRHFSSANDLLAASSTSLIPPPPMPPQDGSLRDRLTAIVVAWAESIAEAPTALALLIGPLSFGRLSTLVEFDYEKVAVADGFLLTFAKKPDAMATASSTESEGA